MTKQMVAREKPLSIVYNEVGKEVQRITGECKLIRNTMEEKTAQVESLSGQLGYWETIQEGITPDSPIYKDVSKFVQSIKETCAELIEAIEQSRQELQGLEAKRTAWNAVRATMSYQKSSPAPMKGHTRYATLGDEED